MANDDLKQIEKLFNREYNKNSLDAVEIRDKLINLSVCLYKKYQKFGKPEHGTNRLTFFSDKNVIKIPINEVGFLANEYEHNMYMENPDSYPLAKNKLIFIRDIPVILMEKVKLIIPSKKEYKSDPWIFSIDCEQVGINRKNKIVAYDYPDLNYSYSRARA